MDPEHFNCDHACRSTCATLSEALRTETKLVEFYEQIMAECDYPEISRFVRELVEERRKSVLRIVQKLNEMYARGEIMDGVGASFDPAKR